MGTNGAVRENLPYIFAKLWTAFHEWIMQTDCYYWRWPRKLQSVPDSVSSYRRQSVANGPLPSCASPIMAFPFFHIGN
jgi:hypothetical protein